MADYVQVFDEADDLTMTAGAAIVGGRLVAVTAANTVQETSAATGAWLGVAAFDAPSGGQVTVVSAGVQELAVAAAVTAGQALMAAANGRVTPLTGADYSQLVGIALTAQATVGQTCRVRLTR